MAIYTVHEPPRTDTETGPDPVRFAFLRDGFSFWAFLLGPLWMLRHRMWLVLLGYVLLLVVLQIMLAVVGASEVANAGVSTLVGLLVGIEAGTLRRFTLARRGWCDLGVIVGDDLEAAERRFFDIWVQRGAREVLAPPRSIADLRLGPALPDIVGLFPQPGVPR
jgi:hypothetical protein